MSQVIIFCLRLLMSKKKQTEKTSHVKKNAEVLWLVLKSKSYKDLIQAKRASKPFWNILLHGF